MRHRLARFTDVLQLTRFATAFAAIANVWLVILWTRANPQELDALPQAVPMRAAPLALLLLGGAAAAIGLYAFTLALNDIVDRRRDRALGADRPIPAGRVGLDTATGVVAASLCLAVLGASIFGTSAVRLTVLVACAALAFNVAGKFVPGAGALLLGLIFAGQMVVPNVHLQFVWPVVLVMTHALAVEWAAWIIGRRRPAISARAMAAAVGGWALWAAAIVGIGSYNAGGVVLWPAWASPMGPVLVAALAIAFVLYTTRKVRRTGMGQRAAEKLRRYGAIWLAFYAVAWLVGQGAWAGALLIAALCLAGLGVMTGVREISHIARQPLGYRR